MNLVNDSHSFGLIGMRERAYALGGKFDLEGKEGQYTSLTVEIPFFEDRGQS